MSASDQRKDDETGSDEPETNGDDVAEPADEIPLGLNEAEARALDDSFSGTDAAPDVLADQAPPDFFEPNGPEFPADTVPLLDASGNMPADFDALYRALVQWEAAAADAPGDPRFTPKPTTKERNELLMLDRGPTVPVVWLDRATMTPVRYSGEKPVAWPSLAAALLEADQDGRLDQVAAMSRPTIVVTVRDPSQHFVQALEAYGGQLQKWMTRIAQERDEYERWSQACEERAINGDWT